ncbi:hypothetical protein GKZ68_15090 [Hymenobacter sp. BRD128]|uniref:phosphatase PAP2-related protein n=1 Tax=Hymenobacter sp. BRD128 TaxID=2675878 RepID=UPI0015636060|nr:phosphatase PAP2-related protein [Hymenobacter sp. BRD128]QKG57834.1 hypothetical protein GKZ68_15090 [Hymenobacter sp. BRD128]
MPVLPSLPTALPTPAEEATPLGAWATALARPAFRLSWALLLVLLFGVLVPLVPGFFVWVQAREGAVLADPLLHLLPRHDVATPVFVLMYGGVLAAVGWLTRQPQLFLRGLWGYLILLLLRISTIWLVALNPPPGLLPMPDPFTALVFHTTASEAITKDLFFSGHTATVALLALAVRGPWFRRGLALVALAIGVLVLVQRVHYSYDVLAAPFFAWFAYWLAGFIVRPAIKDASAATRATDQLS